ncbi:MAG: hypothetical protein OXL39_00765 [Caldilineaceae bacterium]|nr:hypothetical protein [Caldilineaceae bacterium]
MNAAKELEEDPLADVERDAAASARPLTQTDENALPERRLRPAHQAEYERVMLMTVKGRGMRPGIDLNSSDSLLQRMEEQESFP